MKNAGIQIYRVNTKSQEAGSVLRGYTIYFPFCNKWFIHYNKEERWIGHIVVTTTLLLYPVECLSIVISYFLVLVILFFLVHIFLLTVIDYEHPQYQIS